VRCALGHIRGSRDAQLSVGTTGVAVDACLRSAALGNVVALLNIRSAIGKRRGDGSAVDVNAVADESIGGADNVNSGGSIQSGAGEIDRTRVVVGDGRVVRRNCGVLFASGGDIVHLVVTKHAGLALLLIILVLRRLGRVALGIGLSRDD
jgi:hypothetical protein